ncbi:hypothetical protein LAZ67_12002048 [Cordylochernes scorpioides]|uniref:Integrase catalytic domain-containing protein n=1 Tax=Cordylochernes scorpioides TaxID=51811 RepID=A0ABY6L1I5_9ARAC|nr:hypothetical protein LAZ67_12002048 [Cordylochernes scorpioides]
MDQRTCIKFCAKNEIKCADAFRMLTVAYGEATLDRSNVYRWYKMFSEGREDVNDEERAGRPSTSTTDEKINKVEKMILANRRITVIEVAENLNISIGSCHSIFINDLGMRRVAAKFIPKLLNCDQKQHRMNIANEMLDSVRDDPNLLQRVITDDEAWVYGYDVETKALSSQWKLPHEPRPKKARQVQSNVKVLLTVFFDCRGVVHHEFLPQGRTHLLTSAHHPETNAKIERLNSTIINRLRCEYNSSLKIPWTKYIPKITESYNATIHTITGFTPKFLYYGIQPQYIEHTTEKHTPIENARKLSIERTIKSHEHSKQLYDIKHPEPIFKVGDQVLVKTFIYPNTGKLTQRYKGPFKILKQLSPVTYEIDKPNIPQNKKTEIIHSNKLKLFYPETDFLLQNNTNIENNLILTQNSNQKLIDIDDNPCFLQEEHILDMENKELISTPALLPTKYI